ncbi:hypothetical protein CDEST_12374 [Colletotrichum destructivum]|uniref:Uncharacterized protein n=1 Tax=Colletotrichum destructivum TaxID=34406 RepID=A0AAX4IVQ1_9PEZI|nr:hypothetical protein CDEST_12374 [Colletotrichum destructivum]
MHINLPSLLCTAQMRNLRYHLPAPFLIRHIGQSQPDMRHPIPGEPISKNDGQASEMVYLFTIDLGIKSHLPSHNSNRSRCETSPEQVVMVLSNRSGPSSPMRTCFDPGQGRCSIPGRSLTRRSQRSQLTSILLHSNNSYSRSCPLGRFLVLVGNYYRVSLEFSRSYSIKILTNKEKAKK